MKVLVTGATGFIGREIVSELEKNDIEVWGFGSRKSTSRIKTEKNGTRTFFIDISDYADFQEIEKLENIDAIIHSAGLAHQFGDTKKEEFDSVNITGTKNVAEQAVKLKVKQFILISSTAIYGIKKADIMETENKFVAALIDENTDCVPQTDYARSKIEAEKICLEICEKNKIPLTIFRLAPVIGEENVGNVSRLIDSIDRRRFIWIGKGKNLKSLIYKTDVAKACLKILKEKTGATEIFNLAAEPICMKDFVEEIAIGLERKIPQISVSPNFFRLIFQINQKLFGIKKIDKIALTIEKWLSDDVYSTKKITEKYGFVAETSIKKGIEKQIGWYKKQKSSKSL